MNNEVPDISGEFGCLIVYAMFLAVCYLFYKVGISVKLPWFILAIGIYLACTWFYFEFVNQLHYYLRDNKILYVEFGHASLELILLMFFCVLNALVLIGVVFYRRKLKNID